jgi:hypothetical protein
MALSGTPSSTGGASSPRARAAKRLKMASSSSSVTVSPVISPRAFRAAVEVDGDEVLRHTLAKTGERRLQVRLIRRAYARPLKEELPRGLVARAGHREEPAPRVHRADGHLVPREGPGLVGADG